MFLANDPLWTKVEGDELSGLLDQVGTIDGRYDTSATSTKGAWRALPFYEDVVLIRLQDDTWGKENLNVFYLAKEGELTRLDGTSLPIHDTNRTAPIHVSEDNVLDYLRFFCFFVRGEDGPFLICEDMNEPGLPKAPDQATARAIEGTLRPATYEGQNVEGHYMCDAIVYYANALFLANFAIQPTGMIEMLEDNPLLQDLPMRVNAPVA